MIETLNELVADLTDADKQEYNQILRTTNLPLSEYQSCCSWSKEAYTRNCIVENEDFELILLCWEKGQITPIHDHGGEECWVYFVDGDFEENIYKETHVTGGDVTFMVDAMGFHSLQNISDGRSMSLHLYAKPIRNCQVFNRQTSEYRTKKLMYNTISEEATK
jgi:cysteine dioxygenase